MDEKADIKNKKKGSRKIFIAVAAIIVLILIGVICHFRTSIISLNFFEDKEDLPKSLQWVTFERIVDGDTIICHLDNKKIRVRLIGIDTPESVHEDETKNTIYGTMASEHTDQLLEGYSNLYLEYDKEVYDKYDRLLAYVWLKNDTQDINDMLNYIIVNDGYAVDVVYGNNDKYAKQLKTAREQAENSQLGLWSYQEYIDMINE